jgi:hypothetical protein
LAAEAGLVWKGCGVALPPGINLRTFVAGLLRRARQSWTKHGPFRFAVLCVQWSLRGGSHRLRRLVARRRRPPAGAAGAAGFDRRFHVDTGASLSDVAGLARIASPSWKHGTDYQATDEGVFRETMAALPIRHEEFVFIDLGSGKGKALLLASEYPFERIIGVEYSEPLHRIAQSNLAAYRNPAMQCTRIESVCADAAAFAIPPRPCVFYLYNPFDEIILERVVRNIVASLEQVPRPVFAVYWHALHAEVFRRHGFREIARRSIRGADTVVFQGP